MCFDLGKMVVPVEKHSARAICKGTFVVQQISPLKLQTCIHYDFGPRQCLAMPVSSVNLIYYPDGGCTRRPTVLDGSVDQPRWVQPSLTPPTGRDPLGSRLSVVGRERVEDGGAAEAGVLMRGWRIYAWTGVVIDCAVTQIGPVLRIHRYSKFKSYNKEMRAREELALGHFM